MLTAQNRFKYCSKTFLALVSLVIVSQNSNADEPPWGAFPVGAEMSATLFTGRIVRGTLDSRTTNDLLCLTIDREGMSVSSIMHRDDVSAIELVDLQAKPRLSRVGNVGGPMLAANHGSRSANANSRNGSNRAQSLAVFAHVDNWNADPKSDGIRLYLSPKGANGEVLPVLGTVSVQLNVYRGDVRNVAGRLHEEESWSYELSKSDYDQHGAVITLPFRRIQPDSDKDIYTFGTLNVRLKIAGQGVLDATLDDVELRKRSITSDLRKRP
jgi:hypothetical protein